MRYAALLRGINVGGNKKVAMADVRELLTGLGYSDVGTYLQSGNAVFSAPRQPEQRLASSIATAIAGRTGVSCSVLIRTGAELASVLERSPLRPDEPDNPSRFFAVYLSAEPSQDGASALLAESFAPDTLWISGRDAYLSCPDGVADSKLTNTFLEKRLGVTATARNWNTARKLAELTAD